MKKIHPGTQGIIASTLFAALVMLFIRLFYIETGRDSPAVLVTSLFIFLPFSMGFMCAWFWRNIEGWRWGKRIANTFYASIIALLLSVLLLKEGAMCLLIVYPLIIALMLIGMGLGHWLFKKDNNTLNFSVLSVVAILVTIDLLSPHHFETVVEDTMVIHAPPATVWKYVAAYEPIQEKPDYWLFRLGMPCPVNSTVDAHKAGAGRKCIFSNGYVFDEVMTVYEPSKELTFEITQQPHDPEIMGHIDILKGQFLLKDNGDGTTTLTGNSWYRLYVFPAWYYNLWAESITRNVHLRVMQQIKVLSEKDKS